jgi:hypothetical protein
MPFSAFTFMYELSSPSTFFTFSNFIFTPRWLKGFFSLLWLNFYGFGWNYSLMNWLVLRTFFNRTALSWKSITTHHVLLIRLANHVAKLAHFESSQNKFSWHINISAIEKKEQLQRWVLRGFFFRWFVIRKRNEKFSYLIAESTTQFN